MASTRDTFTLFLDIDGVLNRPCTRSSNYLSGTTDIFDPDLLDILSIFITEIPLRVDIVLTSTRRLDHRYIAKLYMLLRERVRGKLRLTVQPMLNAEDAPNRSDAILRYVDEYDLVDGKWAALDDLPLSVRGRNVQTDARFGVRPRDIIELISLIEV